MKNLSSFLVLSLLLTSCAKETPFPSLHIEEVKFITDNSAVVFGIFDGEGLYEMRTTQLIAQHNGALLERGFQLIYVDTLLRSSRQFYAVLSDLEPSASYTITAMATDGDNNAHHSNSTTFSTINYEKYLDVRDGKSYSIGSVGSQIWMLENMDYDIEGSTYYENNQKFRESYGRLYNWEMACNVCPDGWRLPTEDDFYTLAAYAEHLSDSLYKHGWWVELSGMLKKAGEDTWTSNSRTFNAIHFGMLPGGVYDGSSFYNEGGLGYMWSLNEYDMEMASALEINCCIQNRSKVRIILDNKSQSYLSVRCIKKP